MSKQHCLVSGCY